MIQERLNALRALMRENGMDAYLVPTSDFHASEYIAEHFQTRRYLSGFTGSAGTLAVLQGEAGLWTDGRYFLQAGRELEGSGIALYRMGEDGVPTIGEYLLDKLPDGGVLGLDGRTVDAGFCEELQGFFGKNKLRIIGEHDIAGAIWEDRPSLPSAPAFLLEQRYAGVSCAAKIEELRREMTRHGANIHVLTALDDIAWLFNIRGGDVAYTPVLLAYAVIERDRAYLFTDERKLGSEIRQALRAVQAEVLPYDEVYAFVRKYGGGDRVLLSKKRVNYALYSLLMDRVEIVDADNPTMLKKAIKNAREIENLRAVHVQDGVAVTKLIYWLKTHVGREALDEAAVACRMDALRRERPGCIGPSFSTIAGYGANAAIVHYHAAENGSAQIQPEGMLLLDSGGQYFGGTTDITRTIALGSVPVEQKRAFTLVLKGMLRLANARFPYGCRGYHLDAIARSPLWAQGFDYNHGTGHGVGYMLCIHEPPNAFRYRQVKADEACVFEPGMLTSDEPGVYVEGKYGVRTENLILCREEGKNEFGRFLGFETLTLVPVDRDAIDDGLLNVQEKTWLNDYHARVYKALASLLDEEERIWLMEATKPV
jgi:Xaa-Pro aminopeptidase